MAPSVDVSTGWDVAFSSSEVIDSAVFQSWVGKLNPQWNGGVLVNAVSTGEDGSIRALQVAIAREDNEPTFHVLQPETVNVMVMIADGVGPQQLAFIEHEHDTTGCRVFANLETERARDERPRVAAERVTRKRLGLDDFITPFVLDFVTMPVHPVLVAPDASNACTHMMQA